MDRAISVNEDIRQRTHDLMIATRRRDVRALMGAGVICLLALALLLFVFAHRMA